MKSAKIAPRNATTISTYCSTVVSTYAGITSTMRRSVFQRGCGPGGSIARSTGYVPAQPRNGGYRSATRYTYA